MAKVVLFVVVGFLFAWLPFVVIIIVKISGGALSLFAIELPSLFAKTSTVYNPFIYFFSYKQFRARSLHLLRNAWKKIRCKETVEFREPTSDYARRATVTYSKRDGVNLPFVVREGG